MDQFHKWGLQGQYKINFPSLLQPKKQFHAWQLTILISNLVTKRMFLSSFTESVTLTEVVPYNYRVSHFSIRNGSQ